MFHTSNLHGLDLSIDQDHTVRLSRTRGNSHSLGKSVFFSLAMILLIAFTGGSAFAVPAITAVSPGSGPVGAAITLTGTGFSATAANNTVYFGAMKATITSATATSIVTSVPLGATYAPITVTVANLTAYSAAPFLVTYTGCVLPNAITSASLTNRYNFTADTTNNRGVVLADLDLDGKPDAVVAEVLWNNIAVFHNTNANPTPLSLSTFANRVNFATDFGGSGAPGSGSPWYIAVGDLDGDGKLDIAVVNYNANSISIFRNTSVPGAISFAARQDIPTGGINPDCIAIADMNADGKPDLVVGYFGSAYISVFKNSSSFGTIGFAAVQNFTSLSQTTDLAVGDMDGDGKPDVMFIGSASSPSVELQELRNTSTGGTLSFYGGSYYTLPSHDIPVSIAIGDLNGDGKPDVVTSNRNLDGVTNTIVVNQNASTVGSIAFIGTQIVIPAGGEPRDVAITDMNGDGKPDILFSRLVNATNDGLCIAENTTATVGANFTFNSPVLFTADHGPFGIAAGDVDGDGRPDVLDSHPGYNVMSVWHNLCSLGTATTQTGLDTSCHQSYSDLLSLNIDSINRSWWIVKVTDHAGNSTYPNQLAHVIPNPLWAPTPVLTPHSRWLCGNTDANGYSSTDSLTSYTYRDSICASDSGVANLNLWLAADNRITDVSFNGATTTTTTPLPSDLISDCLASTAWSHYSHYTPTVTLRKGVNYLDITVENCSASLTGLSLQNSSITASSNELGMMMNGKCCAPTKSVVPTSIEGCCDTAYFGVASSQVPNWRPYPNGRDWRSINVINHKGTPINSITIKYYDCSGNLITGTALSQLTGGNLHSIRDLPYLNRLLPPADLMIQLGYAFNLNVAPAPFNQSLVTFDLSLPCNAVPNCWQIRLLIEHKNPSSPTGLDTCYVTLPNWRPCPRIFPNSTWGTANKIDSPIFVSHLVLNEGVPGVVGFVTVATADSTDKIVGTSGAPWVNAADPNDPDTSNPRINGVEISKHAALIHIIPDTSRVNRPILDLFIAAGQHGSDRKYRPTLILSSFDTYGGLLGTDTVIVSSTTISSGVPIGSAVPESGAIEITSVTPNPAHTTIEVNYKLGANEQAKLELFNTLGDQVGVLTDGYQTMGEHTAHFIVAPLTDGSYYLRLSTYNGQTSATLKVVH